MICKFHRIILLFLLCTNVQLFSKAKFTFFLYMEASEELQHEAINNISELAQGRVPEEVNIIVQLHTGGDSSWLYKIENNGIFLLNNIPLLPNAGDNIVNSMRIIVDKYPAQHYGIVLWNHGFGILVPKYNSITNTWDVEPDGDNCFGSCDLIHVEGLDKKKRNRLEKIRYKGLLANGNTKTVMNNHDMVKTFKIISQDILGGRKLDICGMDCCLGAMIEHGYQLQNYVHYLIGSQDCEMSDGWDYEKLMHHFANGHLDPHQIAQDIVLDYENYYEPIAPVGRYTQSAIDLSYIEKMKSNLEYILYCLRQCINKNSEFKQLILKARKKCIRFCQMPSYTDISHFYKNLLNLLETNDLLNNQSYVIQQLTQHLIEGKNLIKQAVIANATGRVNKHAQGISIYFPMYHIDSSYPNCMFARESSWLSFLQEIIN